MLKTFVCLSRNTRLWISSRYILGWANFRIRLDLTHCKGGLTFGLYEKRNVTTGSSIVSKAIPDTLGRMRLQAM